MPALRNLLLLTLAAALLFQAALARADDPPKPREFKEDDLALAALRQAGETPDDIRRRVGLA